MPVIATIPSPSSNAIEIGPLTVHYYGIAIALGVLLAITVLRRRYGALGGDPDLADRTALWAVGFGFLGARLAYVLPRVGEFVDRPLSIFAVWEGGLALFGGLLFGALAAVWYLRRNDARLAPFADAVAPAIPLAQAIGRWGNYFNQELYGTPTGLPWALEIDPDRRVAGYESFETFHPTFLYESLYNLVLAGLIVWLGRRGRLRQGSLLLVYAIGYGLGRFLIELIRTDTTFRFLGLSRNNWVALFVCIGGAAALWWWQRRARPDSRRVGDPVLLGPVDADLVVDDATAAPDHRDVVADRAPAPGDGDVDRSPSPREDPSAGAAGTESPSDTRAP